MSASCLGWAARGIPGQGRKGRENKALKKESAGLGEGKRPRKKPMNGNEAAARFPPPPACAGARPAISRERTVAGLDVEPSSAGVEAGVKSREKRRFRSGALWLRVSDDPPPHPRTVY